MTRYELQAIEELARDASAVWPPDWNEKVKHRTADASRVCYALGPEGPYHQARVDARFASDARSTILRLAARIRELEGWPPE